MKGKDSAISNFPNINVDTNIVKDLLAEVSKIQEDLSQFRREREEVDIKIAKLVNSNLEEATLQQDIKNYLDKKD